METGQGQISEFFGREWDRLAGFVRRHLEDSADRDATDLVQDVFASLFERADPIQEIENVSAFVYRSLRNRIVDTIRKRKPHVSFDSPLNDEEGLCLADILPAPGDSPLDDQLSRQREEAFAAAFEALSDRDRDLIVANEFEGRTFRELSEESGEAIGTLLSRKSRAVARLAAAMAEHNPHT